MKKSRRSKCPKLDGAKVDIRGILSRILVIKFLNGMGKVGTFYSKVEQV